MGSEPRFKVAICGAGIGGLVTAVALSRYPDIEVEIYEAAEKLGEVGAGIGIFPRPWEIIKILNLEEELLKATDAKLTDGPVPSFRYRKSDRPEGLEFYTLVTKGNLLTFHRPDFQRALLRKLPPSYRIHCGKRLLGYTQRHQHVSAQASHRASQTCFSRAEGMHTQYKEGGYGPQITLHFEDGSRTVCDVLLGADGLKSAVRKSLLGEKIMHAKVEKRWSEAAALSSLVEPSWSGTNAYREVVPADKLRARKGDHRALTQPTQYLGKSGYIIAYPIAHSKFVNVVAFKSRHDLEGTRFNGPWVCPTEKAEFMGQFRDWESEAKELLECVERPLRWAIHTVKPLPTFVSGNVAILGDAAHAMTPHQGSGAGSAIEDAYILSLLLGHPSTNRETLDVALNVYDRIRRPFAQKVYERSRMNGLYFTFNIPEVDFDKISEAELPSKLNLLSQVFTKNWEWAWRSSVKGSAKEAIRLFESKL